MTDPFDFPNVEKSIDNLREMLKAHPDASVRAALTLRIFGRVVDERGNTFVLQPNHRVVSGDQGTVIEPLNPVAAEEIADTVAYYDKDGQFCEHKIQRTERPGRDQAGRTCPEGAHLMSERCDVCKNEITIGPTLHHTEKSGAPFMWLPAGWMMSSCPPELIGEPSARYGEPGQAEAVAKRDQPEMIIALGCGCSLSTNGTDTRCPAHPRSDDADARIQVERRE